MDVKNIPNLGSNKLLCAQRPGAQEWGGGDANTKENTIGANNQSCIFLAL